MAKAMNGPATPRRRWIAVRRVATRVVWIRKNRSHAPASAPWAVTSHVGGATRLDWSINDGSEPGNVEENHEHRRTDIESALHLVAVDLRPSGRDRKRRCFGHVCTSRV